MANITCTLSHIPQPPPPRRVQLHLDMSEDEARWLHDLTRKIEGVNPTRDFFESIRQALADKNVEASWLGTGPFQSGTITSYPDPKE